MEILVEEIQEETSDQPGDFYSLALFREVDNYVEGLELQRMVGGIYNRPGDGSAPYCVVTDDHSTSVGGITRIAWRREAVDIYLTAEAQRLLGYPDGYVALLLNVPPSVLTRIKAALVRIFSSGDFDYPLPDLVGFEDEN